MEMEVIEYLIEKHQHKSVIIVHKGLTILLQLRFIQNVNHVCKTPNTWTFFHLINFLLFNSTLYNLLNMFLFYFPNKLPILLSLSSFAPL